jgi:excisionase family DNA binding protein
MFRVAHCHLGERSEAVMNPSVFTVAEACKIACTGRTALYAAINSGELVAHKRGKRTLFLANELQRWIESFPKLEVKHPKQRAQTVALSNRDLPDINAISVQSSVQGPANGTPQK